MPYKSNPGGIFNSGVQPDTRPQVNVAELLQAVGSGTGSIIHSMMQRRLAENQANIQQQELGLRQQQATREAGQQTWERQFKEKELAQRGDEARQKAMLSGLVTTPGTPAGDITSQEPITPLQAPQSPIAKAAAARMPGPQITPSATPGTIAPAATPMTATVHDPQLAQPERTEYDPTRDRAIAAANVRADAAQYGADARYDASVYGADTRAGAARDVANTRAGADAARNAARLEGIRVAGRLAQTRTETQVAGANARTAAQVAGRKDVASSAIKGAMTEAQKDKRSVDDALGFLTAHRGATYQDALNTFNNTPEGQSLQESGITESHLRRAFGKMKVDPTTNQIIGLISSGAARESSQGAGDEAKVAASMVDKAKKAANPVKFKADTDTTGVPPESAPKPKLGQRPAAPAAAQDTAVAKTTATAWKAANPKKANESDDQYYERYKAAHAGKP